MPARPCRSMAVFQDPYDDTSSWSSPAAEGGHCTAGTGAPGSGEPDDEYWGDVEEQAGGLYAAGNHVDPLYLYPSCVEDGTGSVVINGERFLFSRPRESPQP